MTDNEIILSIENHLEATMLETSEMINDGLAINQASDLLDDGIRRAHLVDEVTSVLNSNVDELDEVSLEVLRSLIKGTNINIPSNESFFGKKTTPTSKEFSLASAVKQGAIKFWKFITKIVNNLTEILGEFWRKHFASMEGVKKKLLELEKFVSTKYKDYNYSGEFDPPEGFSRYLICDDSGKPSVIKDFIKKQDERTNEMVNSLRESLNEVVKMKVDENITSESVVDDILGKLVSNFGGNTVKFGDKKFPLFGGNSIEMKFGKRDGFVDIEVTPSNIVRPSKKNTYIPPSKRELIDILMASIDVISSTMEINKIHKFMKNTIDTTFEEHARDVERYILNTGNNNDKRETLERASSSYIASCGNIMKALAIISKELPGLNMSGSKAIINYTIYCIKKHNEIVKH